MKSIKMTEMKLEAYENYLRLEEKSELTVQKYVRDIRAFYAALEEDKSCTKEDVIMYKKMLAEEYQLCSVNSILAAINSFMEFAGCPHLKVKQYKIQKKIFRSDEKELSKSEYYRLVEVAKGKGNERLTMILQTICATGIRVSELRYFTVKGIKKGKLEVYCKNKQRIIFIPEGLRKKLLFYCAAANIRSGQIFCTRTGKPLDRSNIWSEMKALCKKAGVSDKKVFPHNLRHLFARVYYKKERDITKLADILGHCSIETTRIYIISTGREHIRQLEGLGLLI